jgi:pimeloyl-ACP methyl ester carboxylesterase
VQSQLTYVVNPEGIPLATRRWGLRRPSVLLLHGFAEGGFVWNSLVAELGESPSMLAMDMRGHGDSGWGPRDRYSTDVHEEDACFIIETLTLTDLVIVGHSVGAEIAIRLASRYDRRTRALVIIDGGPGISRAVTDHVVRQFATQPRRYHSIASYANLLATRMPFASAEVLAEYAGQALRASPAGGFELKCDPALRDWIGLGDSNDLWPRLERAKSPVLVVRGAASAAFSARSAQTLAEAFRRATLVTVPDAGHAVPMDNPHGLANVIRPFLIASHPTHRPRSGNPHSSSDI